MQDLVVKGTGNSRTLKSSIPAGTTWEQALAMFQAGTFPVDLNGMNADGIQVMGTPYSKGAVLPDDVLTRIGLPTSGVPADMFRVVSDAGNLHVWKKVNIVGEDTPSGYTLGEKVSQYIQQIRDVTITVRYSDSISVDENGNISFVSPSFNYHNTSQYVSMGYLAGKFVSYGNSGNETVYYYPDGYFPELSGVAIISDVVQEVKGYPMTPAGTYTTYEVSTQRNAYPDSPSDGEIAARWELGEVVSNVKLTNTSSQAGLYYGESISVDGDGLITIDSANTAYPSPSYGSQGNSDYLKGKFISVTNENYANHSELELGTVYYIPSDATLNHGGSNLSVSKLQPVLGYPAIPATTQFTYLGPLGAKSQVQVLSYVGTGTYGESNPCSVTANFPIKVLLVVPFAGYRSYHTYYAIESELNTDYKKDVGIGHGGSDGDRYTKKSTDGRTISWYHTYSASYQYNDSGITYTLIAFG